MKMKIYTHKKKQLVAKAKIRRTPTVFQLTEESDTRDSGC